MRSQATDAPIRSQHTVPGEGIIGHRHSMNQIQIEWLCDLSEFGEWWVPVTTGLVAKSEANDRMFNRIRNPPGWTCGSPRPIYVPPPPPECLLPTNYP